MTTRTAHIDIQGMTCANCSQSIADALHALDGVREANVNFATDESSVTYEPSSVAQGAIFDAIEDAGYTPISDTVTIGISGMTCSNCAATNAEALESVDGVLDVDVNYATDEAQVTFNPADVSTSALYDAIEDAGYEPIRESDDDSDESTQTRKEAARTAEISRQLRLTLFGAVLSAPLLGLMVAHLFFPTALPDSVFGISLGWVMFGLATPVQAILGRPFYENAYKAVVKNRRANMDVLIALGSSTAYLYSVAVIVGLIAGSLYFDTAAFILVFITLGNYLEARSKGQASEALRALLELEAETATIIDDDGTETEVPLEEVQVGDRVKVRPGEKIPTDGNVVEGGSAVDESMVTGESIPVSKESGDEVIGSTINENGVLVVETTKVGEETAIQQIVQRVKEAQSRQPEIQNLADRISAYFVPAVIANAIFWSMAWYVAPELLASVVEFLPLWGLVAGGPAAVGGAVTVFEFSVIVFASAVLIACPCALGLATPAATMVGTSIGARNGVLFKGGDILERVKDVDTVIFDKTGTLTKGEMALTDVIPVNPVADGAEAQSVTDPSDPISEAYLLEIAATAENGSEHSIGQAIVDGARERDIDVGQPDAFQSVTGKGIRARTSHGTVIVGKPDLLREDDVVTSGGESMLSDLQQDGKTAMMVALDGDLVGILAVADEIKETARTAVSALGDRDVSVHMITGDNQQTANAVAKQVGIDPAHVRAGVLPEDKADAVEAIQAEGLDAMMVGDGVNDAPALAAAYVGTAIGSGTDVAIEAADVTLMRDDPADVVKAIRISDATLQKIKQNLVWALGYNTAMIPLASLGLLQPVLAAGAMAFSSVSVLGNSMLFQRYDAEEDYDLFGFLRR